MPKIVLRARLEEARTRALLTVRAQCDGAFSGLARAGHRGGERADLRAMDHRERVRRFSMARIRRRARRSTRAMDRDRVQRCKLGSVLDLYADARSRADPEHSPEPRFE